MGVYTSQLSYTPFQVVCVSQKPTPQHATLSASQSIDQATKTKRPCGSGNWQLAVLRFLGVIAGGLYFLQIIFFSHYHHMIEFSSQ